MRPGGTWPRAGGENGPVCQAYPAGFLAHLGCVGKVSIVIHPVFCYLGVTLVFGVSLALFVTGKLDAQDYFYAPIVLLIGYYTTY